MKNGFWRTAAFALVALFLASSAVLADPGKSGQAKKNKGGGKSDYKEWEQVGRKTLKTLEREGVLDDVERPLEDLELSKGTTNRVKSEIRKELRK